MHAPGAGQLSRLLAALRGDLGVIRHPHPEVLVVLDPRPLLDEAAAIAARYGGTGWLIAETLAVGVAHGQLWFGAEHNIGRLLARAAPSSASPSTWPPERRRVVRNTTPTRFRRLTR